MVDEAHNLPDRSREMYSAEVQEKSIIDAISALEKEQPDEAFQSKRTVKYLNDSLQHILSWFTRLKPAISSNSVSAGFESAEPDCQPGTTMIAEHFLGMRQLPEFLIKQISKASYFIRKYLDEESDSAEKSLWLKLNFELLFFIKIAELFKDGNHVTTAEITNKNEVLLTCRLMCVDASKYLTQSYYLKRSAVFFSATLSPLKYYIGLIYDRSSENPPSTLMLSSPFPSENLLLLVYSGLSARFRDRDQTMSSMLEIILEAVRIKTGNYLVFVPSFTYLGKIRKLLKLSRPDDLDCQLQIPNMSDQQKDQFIRRFDTFGRRTLLSFAVLGSLFNEGIDLTGEKLSGVIIIGAGLPQISPQREIIRQYFEAKIGSGYAYSYVYPGFNKVQQAAGRLIRSENDRGFVLLMDDRLEKFEYRQLFPVEWCVNICSGHSDIIQQIDLFWES
jgi:DNA excision repair protein ERCC-2